MAKKTINALQVITANDLLSGAVVYLDKHDQWQRNINAAKVFEGADALQSRLDSPDEADDGVVGIEPIGVRLTAESRIEPLLIRERLRLHGPSVDYLNQTSTTQ